MAEPARKLATYEDLLRVPDHKVAEILDGELHVFPRPAPPHAAATSGIGADLWAPFHRGRGGPGGWWIIDEPELHLSADVLVPDVAGWRRERMPSLPETPWFPLAPDWICEVLSPSTERIDRLKKMRIYARQRVRHAWLLNPTTRLLEVYRLETDHWTLVSAHGEGETVRAEPFEAVAIELGDLWVEATEPAPKPKRPTRRKPKR